MIIYDHSLLPVCVAVELSDLGFENLIALDYYLNILSFLPWKSMASRGCLSGMPIAKQAVCHL